MDSSTPPLRSPDPSELIPCPRCMTTTGRFLAPVSHLSRQPFYQCENCDYVWSLQAPPLRPVTPNDPSASS